jgi:hypothetical protein
VNVHAVMVSILISILQCCERCLRRWPKSECKKGSKNACLECQRSKTKCVWVKVGKPTSPMKKAVARRSESPMDIDRKPKTRIIRRVHLKITPKHIAEAEDEEAEDEDAEDEGAEDGGAEDGGADPEVVREPPQKPALVGKGKGKGKGQSRGRSRRRDKGKGKASEDLASKTAIPSGCKSFSCFPISAR